MSQPRELRIEQLLGRKLLDSDGAAVGRIEEFRAQRHGRGCSSTDLLVGTFGLIERLDVGAKLLFGLNRRGYIVRWDQIDVTDPLRPRLTVPIEELDRSDAMHHGG